MPITSIIVVALVIKLLLSLLFDAVVSFNTAEAEESVATAVPVLPVPVIDTMPDVADEIEDDDETSSTSTRSRSSSSTRR